MTIKLQNNWDEQLAHVEFAYNNVVSAATGLAPNEVHMGRLPRLPLTGFECAGVTGHHNLACDHTLRPVPKLAVDDWAWVSDTAATIHKGAKPDTGAKVLKDEHSLNWTGPYKVSAVGPCSSKNTPDGSPLGG